MIAISRIQETTSPLLVSSSEKYEIADDIEETEGRNGVAQVCELYLFHNHPYRWRREGVSCLRREIRLKRELVTRGLAANNARERRLLSS